MIVSRTEICVLLMEINFPSCTFDKIMALVRYKIILFCVHLCLGDKSPIFISKHICNKKLLLLFLNLLKEF